MATEQEEITTRETARREVTGRQAAMIVGGALVLLVLVWFLFLRGGGEEPTEDVAVPPPVETPTDLPTDDGPAGNGEEKPPVETFEVFAPRDPFDPLLTVDTETGGATDTGDGTTDDGTTDEGTTDTDGDGDVDGDDEDTTDEVDTGEEDVDGHTVELISVSGSGEDATAQIQVDDTVYTVETGESFAENFKLLSTSGECATVLFGDDQFTVCEGEEILK